MIIIDNYLETQKSAYFPPQTIMVDCPHNYIANVSTRMAAWQRSESQLFWMQLPVGAHTMNKMSRDGQVWVTDLWCPGIVGERHLTRDILASEWIFILVQQAIGLTLSSSFSRASLRLALLIISLRRVWRWGMSLSESEGRRYVSTRQNGPFSI